MIPPSSLMKALHDFKRDVLAQSNPKPLAFVLFGSAGEGETMSDVDIAIVVQDTTDLFEFVRLISPIVAQHTLSCGRLLSCFPITQANYSKRRSQFFANVKAHGSEF